MPVGRTERGKGRRKKKKEVATGTPRTKMNTYLGLAMFFFVLPWPPTLDLGAAEQQILGSRDLAVPSSL
jgi:hypothetical protein